MLSMSAHEWMLQLLVGGVFGALGQAIRVVVGMKKLHDKAHHQNQSFSGVFNPSHLTLSLLIGFVAGGLGILPSKVNLQAITSQNILLLIGIGYAGADFIEGFIRKSIPMALPATEAEEEESKDPAPDQPTPATPMQPQHDLDLLPPVG